MHLLNSLYLWLSQSNQLSLSLDWNQANDIYQIHSNAIVWGLFSALVFEFGTTMLHFTLLWKNTRHWRETEKYLPVGHILLFIQRSLGLYYVWISLNFKGRNNWILIHFSSRKLTFDFECEKWMKPCLTVFELKQIEIVGVLIIDAMRMMTPIVLTCKNMVKTSISKTADDRLF